MEQNETPEAIDDVSFRSATYLMDRGYTPHIFKTDTAEEIKWDFHPGWRKAGFTWPDAVIILSVLTFALLMFKGWPV